VAQAFIELSREQDRRERKQGKKKKRHKPGKRPSGIVDKAGQQERLASVDDSRGVGHRQAESSEMDKEKRTDGL